jgi:hypothetical protein
MISLRYGSIPIVRETGGLRDTVLSYNKFTDEGNGFTFFNYNAHDMLYTVRRAVHYYMNNREVWYKLIVRGMMGDYSWYTSAGKYMELYEKLIRPATDFSLTEPAEAPAPAAEEAPAEAPAEAAPAETPAEAPAESAAPAAEEAPIKKTRAKRTTKKAETAEADAAEAKPKKTTRTESQKEARKAATTKPKKETAEAKPKTTRTRKTTKAAE